VTVARVRLARRDHRHLRAQPHVERAPRLVMTGVRHDEHQRARRQLREHLAELAQRQIAIGEAPRRLAPMS